MSCFTCGKFFGNFMNDFIKNKDNICNNVQLSEKEKNKQIENLITSLELSRYCCTMRVMSYKSTVEDIVPLDN